MSYIFNPFTKKMDYYETGSSTALVNNVSEHRLTLESGVPVSTSDQTAKTIVYATPYIGEKITLYDGSSWEVYTMEEQSLKLTTSMSAVAIAGDTSLWVASTTTLFVGMSLVGSCISGLTITSITTSNAVLLNASANSAGGLSPDFKLPSNTLWDVCAYLEGSTPRITFGNKWTNTTTRATSVATLDGINVLGGTNYVGDVAYSEGKLKLIGTMATTGVAGQTKFTESACLISNLYNTCPKTIISKNSNASWTYATASYREYNNGSGQTRGEFVIPLSGQGAVAFMSAYATCPDAVVFYEAIGYDSTSSPTGTINSNYSSFGLMLLGPCLAVISPSAGYHYITQLESVVSTGTWTNWGPPFSNALVCIMV